MSLREKVPGIRPSKSEKREATAARIETAAERAEHAAIRAEIAAGQAADAAVSVASDGKAGKKSKAKAEKKAAKKGKSGKKSKAEKKAEKKKAEKAEAKKKSGPGAKAGKKTKAEKKAAKKAKKVDRDVETDRLTVVVAGPAHDKRPAGARAAAAATSPGRRIDESLEASKADDERRGITPSPVVDPAARTNDHVVVVR